MSGEHRKILSFFTFRRVIVPVVLGLSVAAFLFIKDFDKETFDTLNWTLYSTLWLGVSLLLMIIRDVAYMWRLRILTDYSMGWRKAFEVVM